MPCVMACQQAAQAVKVCRCMWLGLDDWEWDDQHTWLLLLFGSFQIFLALAAPVESGCTSAAGMGL